MYRVWARKLWGQNQPGYSDRPGNAARAALQSSTQIRRRLAKDCSVSAEPSRGDLFVSPHKFFGNGMVARAEVTASTQTPTFSNVKIAILVKKSP